MEKLTPIFNLFATDGTVTNIDAFNSGHINNTYRVTTTKGVYVLQKLNSNVFNMPKNVIANKVLISKHLLKTPNKKQQVLQFIPSKSGKYYVKDPNNAFWNAMVYIPNSKVYTKVNSELIAGEAGFITGEFLNITSALDINKLHTNLKSFHSVKYRYEQFNTALKHTKDDLKVKAENEIRVVNTHFKHMLDLDFAFSKKTAPIRVTHNDTKISNILFNSNNKAICVIDTDTIMPGILPFDYGDAIRTTCNTANEDETNLDAVNFNFEFFKVYTNGFFNGINGNINQTEIDLLPKSIAVFPFIMGLRFLTDYLNGNIYYKTSYTEHNLDRCKNQFKLLKSVNSQMDSIKDTIKQYS